jgi:hypothetical protein
MRRCGAASRQLKAEPPDVAPNFGVGSASKPELGVFNEEERL